MQPVVGPDGIHTAGSSSQIADASAAILLTTRIKADELGLRPRARIVDTCLVGGDPVLMLSGPIPATKALNELERTDGSRALITMCCGGGLATGTVIERM